MIEFNQLKKGMRIYGATKYVQWTAYKMPQRYCDSFVVRQVMRKRIRLYGVEWTLHPDDLENWFLSKKESYSAALKDIEQQLKAIRGKCVCDILRKEQTRLKKAVRKGCE